VARWSGVDVDAADAQERSVRTLAAAGGETTAGVGGAVRAGSLGTTAAIHHVPPPGAADVQPLLVARNLSKRFGGVVAVRDVSIEVRRGETLGLIGPNGAGKTTLFELLSGFTRPDSGEIVFDEQPLTREIRLGPFARLVAASPERRGHLGLIRSFQDAALFPTMTVEEVVCLAQERVDPTRLLPSVMGASEPEHAKRERARELIAMMGLEDYRRRQVSELSTGTRRVAELCALLALEPRLLLLDEPSSGIAQRETEALGLLLRRVKQHLGTTMVVIEHDIPLVMGLSDRVVAMEAGQVIAAGSPAEVRSDARVIEAYLGGDVVAIERSGAALPQLAAGLGT
jgi:ABC-type branched-subunit amino acid transport system ATPase component